MLYRRSNIFLIDNIFVRTFVHHFPMLLYRHQLIIKLVFNLPNTAAESERCRKPQMTFVEVRQPRSTTSIRIYRKASNKFNYIKI